MLNALKLFSFGLLYGLVFFRLKLCFVYAYILCLIKYTRIALVELVYPGRVTMGFDQSNARIFEVSLWLNIRSYYYVENKWEEYDT